MSSIDSETEREIVDEWTAWKADPKSLAGRESRSTLAMFDFYLAALEHVAM